MKKLLLGNEAVARGLYEAGTGVVSSYPGTPSTEITQYASEYKEMYSEWAPNEKVALETAIGAATAGKRAFSGMKHVGLNVAADPLFTVSYTGVNAGLVIAVADDPGMHSSQNEQDSRHFARAAKVPMLEPASSQECLDFTKLAFELSETNDCPVFLRLSTRISHSRSLVSTGERAEKAVVPYTKNIQKNVMMPAMARLRHPIVEERMKKLAEWAEDCEINKIEMNSAETGIITSGVNYQYAKEAMGTNASYLKLGMVYPLPEKLIKEFAGKVKKLYIVEDLDPFIEDYCKAKGIEVIGKDIFPMCGEYSQALVAEKILGTVPASMSIDAVIPPRPPVMCAGCPHRGVFYSLKQLGVYVSGDIGCYTLGAAPPLAAIDACVCMGASVSGAHGVSKAVGKINGKLPVAVIGDSTFAHSGVTGLINIAYNNGKAVTMILDNSITGMTGHQHNPTTGYNIHNESAAAIDLEALCAAVGMKNISVIDPYDIPGTLEAIKTAVEGDEPAVIIARRACALLKTVKHNEPFKINAEKCIGCKACLRVGCPAASMKGKKIVIDQNQCVGCGQCVSLCKFGAIEA